MNTLKILQMRGIKMKNELSHYLKPFKQELSSYYKNRGVRSFLFGTFEGEIVCQDIIKNEGIEVDEYLKIYFDNKKQNKKVVKLEVNKFEEIDSEKDRYGFHRLMRDNETGICHWETIK